MTSPEEEKTDDVAEKGKNDKKSKSPSTEEAAQAKKPDEEESVEIILEPQENDVLLGRGGKNNQHVGNAHFRQLARLRRDEYQRARKKLKVTISRELVDQVREKKGRFLKKSGTEGWQDVGDDVAREKASQLLRDTVSGREIERESNSSSTVTKPGR